MFVYMKKRDSNGKRIIKYVTKEVGEVYIAKGKASRITKEEEQRLEEERQEMEKDLPGITKEVKAKEEGLQKKRKERVDKILEREAMQAKLASIKNKEGK